MGGQKWVAIQTKFCPMSNINVLCMHNTFKSRRSTKLVFGLSKMELAKQTKFCRKFNVECDFVFFLVGLKWHIIM